jgi:hypothetical protein
MNTIRKACRVGILIGVLVVMAAFAVLVLSVNPSPRSVSAHTNDAFGPACGAATLDGIVDPTEWISASSQTFQMVPPGSAVPFTATLYVMNSGHYLYMGITITDDEFSTSGTWLPQGDGFRIDFDNDRSGSLFALNDDVLGIAAGSPQFSDNYLYAAPTHSSQEDVRGGGTADGTGAASRVGGLNHFELKHPLCSGDALDFCRPATSIVGFRLEYLDAQGDGSFGGSQFYPGRYDTSIADIVIGTCSAADLFTYLPYLQK